MMIMRKTPFLSKQIIYSMRFVCRVVFSPDFCVVVIVRRFSSASNTLPLQSMAMLKTEWQKANGYATILYFDSRSPQEKKAQRMERKTSRILIGTTVNELVILRILSLSKIESSQRKARNHVRKREKCLETQRMKNSTNVKHKHSQNANNWPR